MNHPQIGDEIYVDTSLFLSHGRDDFIGGKARVISVEERLKDLFVTVEERPNAQYNWESLAKKQDALREHWGDKRAHADPDMSPEFNEW